MKHVAAFFLFLICLRPAFAVETFQPVAVVELFTSQGCSACPSADLLLSTLVAASRKQGLHLYPLSFHVDYWNYLGWRDPYSQRIFSQRQQRYAKQMKEEIYTPQIIINGRYSLNGSERKKTQKLINKSLTEPTSVSIELKVLQMDHKRLLASFRLRGNWKGKHLSVALVERGLSTDVPAGENAGRRLNHDNVVRQFQRLAPVEAEGSFIFAMVPTNRIEHYSLIAFAQDPVVLEVLGASAIDLNQPLAP